MPSHSPSLDQFKRAIAISEQIETLKKELSQVLSGDKAGNAVSRMPVLKPHEGKIGKRQLSREARERIIAAQKARWARVRGEKSSLGAAESKTKPAKKGKTVVSPEARARMAESARKRWAKKN